MDKREQFHNDSVPKIRKTSSSVAVSAVKRLAPPKTIKVACRPATANPHAPHASGKVSVVTSPKADNTYALKARREWEQAMQARKSHEFRSPNKLFPDGYRRKRAGDVSPSDTSADNIRPAVRPPDVTVAALKGYGSSASSNVVSPSAYAARRPVTSPTNAGIKRAASGARTSKSELESTQSVTILRIREPERVPVTDLDIPVVPALSHLTHDTPPLKPVQRSDPSPLKRSPGGSPVLGHTASFTAAHANSPAPKAVVGNGLGPSLGNSIAGHSPPKPALSQYTSQSQPNSRAPSFMSLPPGYAVKPAPAAAVPAKGPVVGVTQPRTIAFVFPVLQAAVQQGIISAHQCHQLTSLFASKPLPPAEPDLHGVGSFGPPQSSWPPIPHQQPIQSKSRSAEMVLSSSLSGSYASPGPPARTPLQSPPPPARHPPARDVKDAAVMLDDRLGRRSLDGASETAELFNAVCSALQLQSTGKKDGGHHHLNGHRHAVDHRGLPCSPTSSCGSHSESSSAVSESVVMLPAPESPKPARAVLYRTFTGDTVVIPPLNFRLLRK